jgi:uncharacterized membrane protein
MENGPVASTGFTRPSTRVTPPPPLPKARIEALTDGIFAVAMTLLVLDVHFPEPTASGNLLADMWGLVDLLDNYVISFVVLAVFWLGHLRIMRHAREADAAFTLLNLALLFLITLVPPLTTLLGDHPDRPRAALLYGGNLMLMLACEMLLWRRLCRRLADESLPHPTGTWRKVRRRYEAAIGVVVLGIVAALLEIEVGASRGLSAWIYLLLIGLGAMRVPLR